MRGKWLRLFAPYKLDADQVMLNNGLQSILQSHGQCTPEKIAFSFYVSDELLTVSYSQLNADIEECLATGRYGQPGELVFIASSINYRSIVAYLSCLFNNAVPAFLSPLTPRQDKRIYESEMQVLLHRFQPNMLVDAEGERRLHDRENQACQAHTGFLQFSSGTTSLKKGVLITQTKLMAQLESLSSALAITSNDKIASWLPLYHDMGLITSLFLPLYYGCSVAYLDPVEWSYRPDSLFKVIEQEQATLCWQPDFAFRHLCRFYEKANNAEPRNLSSLRYLINCSEPCRKSTFVGFMDAFRTFFLREGVLQTCYAMAETVFAISQSQFKDLSSIEASGDFLPSGWPIEGGDIKVVDISAEGFGEIHVKCGFLFDGYFNQDTTALLPDGWYNTGDFGLIKDGLLYVMGRLDDTLIVNGKKIIAHQIEEYVGLLPGFKPGRVFCALNEDGSALTVYFEGEGVSDAEHTALRKWLACSSAVSLDRLVNLPYGTLVKSSSGKIARKKTLFKLNELNRPLDGQS